jgi:hypothetical protein
LKSLPYGSSVPEIDVADVQKLELVCLDKEKENHIADLAEHSAKLRSDADIIENEIAIEAENILKRFIAGGKTDLRA